MSYCHIYDTDSRYLYQLNQSEPLDTRRTLDCACSPGFAYCIIYPLSRASVPKESAIKLLSSFRKTCRLNLAGYHLDVCPVFTVRASITAGASK